MNAPIAVLAFLALPAFASNPVRVPHHLPPPPVFKGVYLSFWSAGESTRIAEVLRLRGAGLNAVVIDVKDSTGTLGYKSNLPEVVREHASIRAIRDLDVLTARLHEAGIYVIARIAVFEDPRFAAARPGDAVHRNTPDGPLWQDRKGLSWVDAGAREAWAYNAAIGREVYEHGFDELNFDYVRFPSDGILSEMSFPGSGRNPEKRAVLRKFFEYMRAQFPGVPISADLFGLTTVRHDDLGIGQVIEDAAPYFDYLCPMVYPSHYAKGFAGFAQPADHPYEVVRLSLDAARVRLWPDAVHRVPTSRVKLRPWLQEFNLGADYTPAMVHAQIQATKDALGERYVGFLLWNPRNVYNPAALSDGVQNEAGAPTAPAR